jgi:hypothetical protein
VTTRLAGLGSFDTPIFSKTGIKAITVNKLWSIPDWLRSATFRHAFTRPHGSLPLNWPLATDHSLPATRHPLLPSRRAPVSSLATGHYRPPSAKTSGFRSCAGPPPLAPAFQPTPNCQRWNKGRSGRPSPLSHYSPNGAISAAKSSIELHDRRRRMTADRRSGGPRPTPHAPR